LKKAAKENFQFQQDRLLGFLANHKQEEKKAFEKLSIERVKILS
jgi:hypothetical protein